MAFDLLGGLKKLVQQAEADNEPIIVKEDPTEEEEPVVEKEDTTVEESEEEAEVKKEDDETEEESEEELVVEKEDEVAAEDDDEFEAKVTAIVKKVLAELEAEDTSNDEVIEEEEPEDEDTPKITKSRKVINDTQTTIENTNYYTISGRDPVTGCKIR